MKPEFSGDALCRAGGTTLRGLRFWEDQGLLGEVARTAGDQRRYTAEQMDRVKIIAAAQFGNFDLATIKEMLDEFHKNSEVHDALISRLADQVRAAARLAAQLPKPNTARIVYDL